MYLKLAFFLLRTVDCGFGDGDADADADVEFGWRGNEKLVVDIIIYAARNPAPRKDIGDARSYIPW